MKKAKRKPFRKEFVGWLGSRQISDMKASDINAAYLCKEPCGAEIKNRCIGCRQVRIVVESVEE